VWLFHLDEPLRELCSAAVAAAVVMLERGVAVSLLEAVAASKLFLCLSLSFLPSLVLVVSWFGLSLVPFFPVSVSVRLCVQMAGVLQVCNVCLYAVFP
jgi:hypothetical protein